MAQPSLFQAESLVEQAQFMLDEAFLRFPIKKKPLIEWRPYRTTAGRAAFKANAILLSSLVLTDSEKLRDTLLHEYAHLLAFHREGKAAMNHGLAWQQAMRDLGVEPERTHKYDCKRNQSRQVVIYRCDKCGSTFPRKRRLPQRRAYLHRDCGGKIKLHGVEPRKGDCDEP
ncbi:MAG: SprT-like domain-containing protein [Armatimonadetes bacterium]|nr:SprT-like domain-containing protein [Armatimonadota bacterium]